MCRGKKCCSPKIICLAIGVVIVVLLFFWNMIDANSSEVSRANHFTAISGWVSFLGTLLVGVIAIIQTKIYDKKTTETNNTTQALTKQIKDYLWKLNLPKLVISQDEDIIETRQRGPFSYQCFEGMLYKNNTDSIVFNLCKETEHRLVGCEQLYFEDIECKVTNSSENFINSISILEFCKQEHGKEMWYNTNLREFFQGEMGPHDSRKIIFRIFNCERMKPGYFDISLNIRFTL